MKGLGIDITEIARFKKIKKNDFKNWQRVFTKSEWRYAFSGVKSAERLAGLFAAKEAALKASAGIKKSFLSEWEIGHAASGAPKITFRGQGKKWKKTLVSVSHDGGKAIAAVALI